MFPLNVDPPPTAGAGARCLAVNGAPCSAWAEASLQPGHFRSSLWPGDRALAPGPLPGTAPARLRSFTGAGPQVHVLAEVPVSHGGAPGPGGGGEEGPQGVPPGLAHALRLPDGGSPQHGHDPAPGAAAHRRCHGGGCREWAGAGVRGASPDLLLLAQEWGEKALFANLLGPALRRERWRWDRRHQDFDLYTRPPAFLELPPAPKPGAGESGAWALGGTPRSPLRLPSQPGGRPKASHARHRDVHGRLRRLLGTPLVPARGRAMTTPPSSSTPWI